MVIQERTDHESVLTDLDILGNLYAAKTKKVGPQGLQGITKVKSPSGTAAAYTCNIAHFLNDVKGVFKNTFSNDVYQTLGIQREQDDFANGLMYSIDDSDTAYLAAAERNDMETTQKMVTRRQPATHRDVITILATTTTTAKQRKSLHPADFTCRRKHP